MQTTLFLAKLTTQYLLGCSTIVNLVKAGLTSSGKNVSSPSTGAPRHVSGRKTTGTSFVNSKIACHAGGASNGQGKSSNLAKVSAVCSGVVDHVGNTYVSHSGKNISHNSLAGISGTVLWYQTPFPC